MTKITIDKSRLKDKMGRPLTQGLFLEFGYNTDHAVFTLEDDHKMYKGGHYPSLKKLYLESEDVTGYLFSNKYLLGWKHWQRLQNNKLIASHIKEWEQEMEIRLTALGIQGIIDVASSESGFQANKWLAEKGWVKRGAGRPSNEEIERNIQEKVRINEEFSDDFERLGLQLIEGSK